MMSARREPSALEARCAECGREFHDARAMMEVGQGVYVHTHACEGFRLGPNAAAPLAFVAACFSFGLGVILLAYLDWLWPAAVALAAATCVGVAWRECRRKP